MRGSRTASATEYLGKKFLSGTYVSPILVPCLSPYLFSPFQLHKLIFHNDISGLKKKPLKPVFSLLPFPFLYMQQGVLFCLGGLFFLGSSFSQDKSADYGHELNPHMYCIFSKA